MSTNRMIAYYTLYIFYSVILILNILTQSQVCSTMPIIDVSRESMIIVIHAFFESNFMIQFVDIGQTAGTSSKITDIVSLRNHLCYVYTYTVQYKLRVDLPAVTHVCLQQWEKMPLSYELQCALCRHYINPIKILSKAIYRAKEWKKYYMYCALENFTMELIIIRKCWMWVNIIVPCIIKWHNAYSFFHPKSLLFHADSF